MDDPLQKNLNTFFTQLKELQKDLAEVIVHHFENEEHVKLDPDAQKLLLSFVPDDHESVPVEYLFNNIQENELSNGDEA